MAPLAEAAGVVHAESDDPLAPAQAMQKVPESPESFVERITFEEEIYGLRVQGKSLLAIANHLTIKHKRRWLPDEVNALIEKVSDEKSRKTSLVQEIRLDVERIDRLIEALWPECLAGNIQAVAQFEKLSRRKAEILGTDAAEVKASVLTGEGPDLSTLTTDELKTYMTLLQKTGAAGGPRVTRTVTGKVAKG